MDSKKKSLIKATSWRILASIITALIAWIFGLPIEAVTAVFIADLIIKFIMYYVHERAWSKINL